MSLLDDAQQIERDGPPQYSDIWLCCQRLVEKGHAADCHWLSMPQIAAVIEAAQALIDDDGPDEPIVQEGVAGDFVYAFCGWLPEVGHMGGCKWQALVAALKGTSVPA